jgi:hypothetical protein
VPRTVNTDEDASRAATERLITRLRTEPPAIVITATDTNGDPVRVRLRDVHAALDRALPGRSVRVGRDFWTGRDQRVSLRAYLAAVEQQLQLLTMRVRELEAAHGTPTVLVTIPPPIAVERIQTVERDKDRLITRNAHD